MIIAFVGTPGSGKTYEAVVKIVENLKLGRKIYTNIDGLDDSGRQELIRNYCGIPESKFHGLLNFIPDEDLSSFWNICDKGSLIVLDEVQKVFRNRDWSSQKNVDFSNWASTHRHNGYDVILLTQFLDSIEKGVRELVEWTYKFRKLNMFGSMMQKFSRGYFKMAFVGTDTTKEAMQKVVCRYRKEIFPLYSSYVAKDIKELGIMSHGNVLARPVFIIIPVIFVVFMVLASKSSLMGGGVLGVAKAKKDHKQVAKIVPVSLPDTAVASTPPDVSRDKPPVDGGGADVRRHDDAVARSRQVHAPQQDELGAPDQLWGATVYSGEGGRKEVFEGGKYVGWYKVSYD